MFTYKNLITLLNYISQCSCCYEIEGEDDDIEYPIT